MGLLDKIFSSGAGSLVESVGNVVDKFVTTDKEREAAKLELTKEINRTSEAMQASVDKELELTLKDVADARAQNIAIQNSDKASWLSKNVAFLIDIFIILLWGALTVYLLGVMLSIVQKVQGVDYTGVTAIWGGVTAIATTIINYHRGSSTGSKSKQEMIDKMTSR